MILQKQRLYPLHLTPFELYMLMDDSPEYSMSFQHGVELTGRLDRVAFEAAFADALSFHPLLTAIVRPAKRGMECWVQDSETQVALVYCSSAEEAFQDACGFIDLRQEPGLKVWVREEADRVFLTMQFHHSVCDGIGAHQFLGDWLYKYAELTGEKDLPPREIIAPDEIRERFKFTVDLRNFLDDQGNVRAEWAAYDRLKQGSFQPLSNPSTSAPDSPRVSFPGFLTHTLSRDQNREIRALSMSHGASVHDWVLAQLFYLMRDWNEENGGSEASQADFGVLLPLSLRGPGFQPFAACNVVSYAIVGRAARDIDDGAEFLRGLGKEIDELKRQRSMSSFVNMLAAIRLHPELLLDVVREKQVCRSTAVMSTTGDATNYFRTRLPLENGMVRCGNLRLETITGIPPLRSQTKIALSLSTNRRREMQIGMRCDPHSFSAADTTGLLGRLVERLASRGVGS